MRQTNLLQIFVAMWALSTPVVAGREADIASIHRREPVLLFAHRGAVNIRAKPIPALFRRQTLLTCDPGFGLCKTTNTCIPKEFTCCDFGGGCRPGTVCESVKPGETDGKSGCCDARNGYAGCTGGGGVKIIDANTPFTTSTSTTETKTLVIVETTVTPSSEPTQSPEIFKTKENDKPNAGVIAGGAVGGAVGLAIIAILAFFLVRRHRNNKALAVSTPSTEIDNTSYFGAGKGEPSTTTREYTRPPLSTVASSTIVSPSIGAGGFATKYGSPPSNTDEGRTEAPSSPTEEGGRSPIEHYGWQSQGGRSEGRDVRSVGGLSELEGRERMELDSTHLSEMYASTKRPGD
ncbi:hypothetical protein BJ508DRAFT_336217 [Ascobolus immersus RN42]|uniref:Mid2 domain-containing protein n=1 Tax=Ascobolus immersus RN42 TaxID=1160509 RepID=A0A3N4H9E0_ASCIM|nr:hypothetical protein BJ508DRAFT_336217 [Ascobolus immersus RN42]